MGLIGKFIVRAIASAAIVLLLMTGIYGIGPFDLVQAGVLVFAIISTDGLIEKYLSGEKEE